MKQINDRTMRMLVLLIVTLLMVSAFRFGYMPAYEKCRKVELENIELQGRLDDLNKKLANVSTYESGNEQAKEKMGRILERYAVGNTPEKSIMICSGLEAKSGSKISSLSFGQESLFFESHNVPSKTGLGIYGMKSQLGMTYQTSYQGMKEFLLYISEYPERMNLNSISISYNSETGYLTGSAVINLYSLPGTEKEYISPVISGIDIGTENIFKTMN